jgi:hypothetical protein
VPTKAKRPKAHLVALLIGADQSEATKVKAHLVALLIGAKPKAKPTKMSPFFSSYNVR